MKKSSAVKSDENINEERGRNEKKKELKEGERRKVKRMLIVQMDLTGTVSSKYCPCSLVNPIVRTNFSFIINRKEENRNIGRSNIYIYQCSVV